MHRRCKMASLIVVLATCLCIMLCVYAHAVEYENLDSIHKNIISNADISGGDATWFRLTDSTGTVIWTEGGPISTNIYYLKIAKGGTTGGRTNILVTGNQHANEWIGYRGALDMASFVISNRNIATWPTNSTFDHFRKFKDMNISNLTGAFLRS